MLPEQLGLHCCAISTHPDELVLEPPLKKSWIRLCIPEGGDDQVPWGGIHE